MRMGRFEFQDLRRFQEKLNRLGESEIRSEERRVGKECG